MEFLSHILYRTTYPDSHCPEARKKAGARFGAGLQRSLTSFFINDLNFIPATQFYAKLYTGVILFETPCSRG